MNQQDSSNRQNRSSEQVISNKQVRCSKQDRSSKQDGSNTYLTDVDPNNLCEKLQKILGNFMKN